MVASRQASRYAVFVQQENPMRLELRDALEFLYADSTVSKRPCETLAVDVARGGIGSVHVLLNGLTPGQAVRMSVRSGGKAVRAATWFRLIDVPVESNTGPVGFIEKAGERNPFVARRAPFRVCDAMEPVQGSLKAAASTLALRLHVPATRPGRHAYALEIQSGTARKSLSFVLRVHPVAVPLVGAKSLPYTNWFSFALMAERHGLQPWSESHWRMIRRYAELMVHARQNTFWVPLGDIFSAGSQAPVLNRLRLRRIVKTFTDAGMHFIEGGHLANRTGGEWLATSFEIAITKTRATAPEGNIALAGLARQLVEEIDRNGWRDRWIQHVTDEPTEGNAVDYRILVGMVRRHMPGLPILDATMDPRLVGSVNIWCPQAQEYQKHRAAFEAQRAFGDRIWFYTCCFPGGPWLNRLLDQELLRPALFGWGAARFGLDGFLHWGLNHYRPEQDPFEKSVVNHGGENFLPAGDTHIVYPGKGGPWSSLRLEAQREGFEDFELLRLLRARNSAKADLIIRKAFRRFDQYTKNVKVFRAARKDLLAALR
jgi:hypothetical protein